MKKAFAAILVSLVLVGCATPAQNALLGGAVAGAVVSTIITSPPPPPRPIPRPLHCQTVLTGYDVYHRPIYQQVCR
jgi:hypothetical protein